MFCLYRYKIAYYSRYTGQKKISFKVSKSANI